MNPRLSYDSHLRDTTSEELSSQSHWTPDKCFAAPAAPDRSSRHGPRGRPRDVTKRAAAPSLPRAAVVIYDYWKFSSDCATLSFFQTTTTRFENFKASPRPRSMDPEGDKERFRGKRCSWRSRERGTFAVIATDFAKELCWRFTRGSLN